MAEDRSSPDKNKWDGHAATVYVERDFRRYLECGILADRADLERLLR